MVKTIIDGHKRFGLPEDWAESIPIGELIEHFNLLASDAKKISDAFSVILDEANKEIARLEEEE